VLFRRQRVKRLRGNYGTLKRKHDAAQYHFCTYSMPFCTFNLGNNILKAIQEAGYVEPTPIQSSAIPLILAGHDLIGIAQTGTGKTAAFVLPILAKLSSTHRNDGPQAEPGSGPGSPPSSPRGGGGGRQIRALIIAPTRELVVQIEENVRAYGRHLALRAATVYGGVSERPQIEALRSGVELVVATPGRLLDLMNRRLCDFSRLDFLVLDEAERMLDMGFLPDIRRIIKALRSRRQTLLFSATLSREIETITHEFLRAPKTVQIGRRANPAETVAQFVYEVPRHLKLALLVHLLRQPSLNMVLIFSRMKHGADRVARSLEAHGIRTATLHSNRSQNQRLRALKDFKSGAVRVLVATDIAARGIDVDGISHVVNYDFPLHPEDYVHRIGRTGRAHAVGDAISFVMPEDQNALRSLERFIGRGIVRKRSEEFNYAAAAAAKVPDEQRQRRPVTLPAPPKPAAGQNNGGNSPRRNGFRSVSRRRRTRWGRY
jgi:ATP-dependent RNA helicase RhlE